MADLRQSHLKGVGLPSGRATVSEIPVKTLATDQQVPGQAAAAIGPFPVASQPDERATVLRRSPIVLSDRADGAPDTPSPRSAIDSYLQSLVDRSAFDIGQVRPAQRLLQEEIPSRDRGRPTYDFPRAMPPMERRQPNRFGIRAPTLRDHIFEQYMYAGAAAARRVRGHHDASRHLRHFLDGSGATLNPNIPGMIRGIPGFAQEVQTNLQSNLREQIESRVSAGARGTFDVATSWQPSRGADDGNWQTALGGFNFAHTARVRAVPLRDGSVEIRAYPTLHVFDRYDWRPGEDTRVIRRRGLGRFVPERLRVIQDTDMAALVESGLAREYQIRGSQRQPEIRWRVRAPRPARRPHR